MSTAADLKACKVYVSCQINCSWWIRPVEQEIPLIPASAKALTLQSKLIRYPKDDRNLKQPNNQNLPSRSTETAGHHSTLHVISQKYEPCIQCFIIILYIDWLMIAYIALFSALLSRLTALACGSTWVTSFIEHFWISTEVVYLQRWHGWCHMKLQPSRRKSSSLTPVYNIFSFF